MVDGSILNQDNPINESEITALEAVWNLYNTDENISKKVISAFMNEWDSYPSLKKLHTWWNALPLTFDITHVGTVLAHTNARRCDKSIPELPLAT